MADNNLGGGEGTKEICKMLTLNRYLRKINLSGSVKESTEDVVCAFYIALINRKQIQ